jgi:hypothetical protein
MAGTVTRNVLDFAGLLGALGFVDDEFVSILYWVGDDEHPHAAVGTPSKAPAYADQLPYAANAFFGVNPVKGPRRRGGGRGKEVDVTRLAALVCDLDFKPGGCGSRDVALAIIAEIGIVLGTRASIVVDSGHGLHAYWPVVGGQITGDGIGTARALLRRFGRLVTLVADRHNARADTVFDLARVLRLVGSRNNKDRIPILVTAVLEPGGPLTPAEVDERLTEYGIVERPDDRAVTGDEISSPVGWTFANRTCPYVAAMIARWPTDRPKPGGGRNPYVYGHFIRLFCAYRLGCLAEPDYQRARQVLGDLLAELVSTIEPRRAVKRFEIADMHKHGIARVAAKTDEQASAELGRHRHLAPVGCWTPSEVSR